MDDLPLAFDRRKIRTGLAIISVVVVVAVAGLLQIDSPVGRAVMFAIVVVAFVRLYRLTRALRREG